MPNKYICQKCEKDVSTIYANKEEHMMLCWDCNEEALDSIINED